MTFTQKTKDYSNYAIGTVTGWAVYRYVPKYLIGKPLEKVYQNLEKKISESEHIKIWNIANKALEQSDIKDKGVKFIDVQYSNYLDLTREANKNNRDDISFIDEKFSKMNKEAFTEIAHGHNAAYSENISKICINKNKMGYASVHELGHAIIWKNGGWKSFNCGMSLLLTFAIPFVVGIALLKNKKKENDKPKGIIDKFTMFIRNNIAATVGIMAVPTLFDEALASINGAKAIKNISDKQTYNKVNKFNSIAFSTYIISLFTTMLFAHLGVKVKDVFTENNT